MFCGNCGKLLEDEDIFCPYCGTRVGEYSTGGEDRSNANRNNSTFDKGQINVSAETFNKDSETPNQYRNTAHAAQTSKNSSSAFIIVFFVAVAVIAAVLMMSGEMGSLGGLSNFEIEGKWKNVGDSTFGQAQSGAIVVFNGEQCNLVSPADTYAFYKDGSNYTLECTTALFAETLTFTVEVIDSDRIHINTANGYLDMQRVG